MRSDTCPQSFSFLKGCLGTSQVSLGCNSNLDSGFKADGAMRRSLLVGFCVCGCVRGATDSGGFRCDLLSVIRRQQQHLHHLETLSEMQILELHPRRPASAALGWGPNICVCTKGFRCGCDALKVLGPGFPRSLSAQRLSPSGVTGAASISEPQHLGLRFRLTESDPARTHDPQGT